MVPYEIYKIMHLLGVFMVLAALFGWTINYYNGGEKQNPAKKILGITHGIGLVLILIGGFGLLARINQSVLQLWVSLKLSIWFIFGFYTLLLHKRILKPNVSWFVILGLATSAIYVVQYKF